MTQTTLTRTQGQMSPEPWKGLGGNIFTPVSDITIGSAQGRLGYLPDIQSSMAVGNQSVSDEQKRLPSADLARIDKFSSLKSGWNGYKAVAPSTLALELAKRLAVTFDQHGVPFDRIAPSVAGGVGLRRKRDSRKAYIEIYNSGIAYVLLVSKDVTPRAYPVRVDALRERKQLIAQVRDFLDE